MGHLLASREVSVLLDRVRAELADAFLPGEPIRIARSPGRLDVMGGIADYTGSLVCEMPLDRAAAVALHRRRDRLVQVFSFNLLDADQPFTLGISLDQLAKADIEALRREFDAPGRKWAAYLVGCLAVLAEEGLVELSDPNLAGFNLALYSSVPLGAGVSSSAAIEVATMIALIEELNLRETLSAMQVASLCQRVENRIVGAPCGIMDQATSAAGREGALLRMICQPHQLQPPLTFPRGVRAVGINSNVKHSVGGGEYGKTRCAAFMGHAILLQTMRRFAREGGQVMTGDPMKGYLANLDPADYKAMFRPLLPEEIEGGAFLEEYGPTIDLATTPAPGVMYRVQDATDHHVLEARRVREFVGYLQKAASLELADPQRKLALDKAGHLMYASHHSYTHCAHLGSEACDVIVQAVREREHFGLYGAKITGGGSGGTVAVLCNTDSNSDDGLAEVMAFYESTTGNKPELFAASSDGGWVSGSVVV